MECTIVQYVVFLNVTVLFIVSKHCVQRLYHDLILFHMSTNNKYKTKSLFKIYVLFW